MAKRRANGEGNLRKRKDGRWEGRYTAGHDPETGKAIYRNVLGKTQSEARSKLKAAIEEAKHIDPVKSKKYTVGKWMDEWFENYAKVKVRPSSHQTYRGYIDNHIKPNIGKIPLEKLTSLELQKLYKKLLTRGRVDRLESKGQPKGLRPAQAGTQGDEDPAGGTADLVPTGSKRERRVRAVLCGAGHRPAAWRAAGAQVGGH